MPNGLNLWCLKKQWKWGSRVLAMFDFLPPSHYHFFSMHFWSHFVDWTKNLSFTISFFWERVCAKLVNSGTRPGNRQSGQLFHEFSILYFSWSSVILKNKTFISPKIRVKFLEFLKIRFMLPPLSLFKVVL